MPNIREYSAGTGELRPSETGEVSLVRSAARVAEMGSEGARTADAAFKGLGAGVRSVVDVAEKHATNLEISHGSADVGLYENKLEDGYQNALKDPNAANDPQFAAKQMQTINAAADQFLQRFQTPGGKEWAQNHMDAMRENYSRKIVADQRELAKVSVTNNADIFRHSMVNLVEKDPTQAGYAKSQVLSTLNAQADGAMLGPIERAKFLDFSKTINKDIDTTALNKMALNNPGAARAQYEKGAYPDVEPREAETLLKMGDSLARQNAATARANAALGREEKDRADRADFFRNGGTLDPSTGTFVVDQDHLKQMISSAGKPGGTSASTIQMALAYSNKPDVRSGDGVLHAALNGAMTGTWDTNKILSMVGVPGGLSKQDAEFVIGMSDKLTFADKQLTGSFLKEAQARLIPKDGLLGAGPDPIGQGAMTQFTNWFQQTMMQKLKAGVSIHSLFDSNSTDYIMKGHEWTEWRADANMDGIVNNLYGGARGSAAALGAVLEGDKDKAKSGPRPAGPSFFLDGLPK